VERAFGAISTSGDQSEDGNANNISQSFDQGHAPNLPAKLSTKEKLRQLQAMLQQLENDVDEASDEHSEVDDWDDSDGSPETKTEPKEDGDKKPAAALNTGAPQSLPRTTTGAHNSIAEPKSDKAESAITSAQAKLSKELIKLATTYKIPELTFTDQANR
jgi:hypothetical protein